MSHIVKIISVYKKMVNETNISTTTETVKINHGFRRETFV